MAPLEVIAVEFSGLRFKGEVLGAIQSAVDSGAIRIIDVVFIRKEGSARATRYELAELDEPELALYDLVVDETRGLLSVADIAKIVGRLAPNSSAAVLVFEQSWTAEFQRAIAHAAGRIVLHERIAEDVARAALNFRGTAPRRGNEGAEQCSDA
jgi:hypothetical protein